MFNLFGEKEVVTVTEHIRFNTETCEKYVFTNAPIYTADLSKGPYVQIYEVFKAHGKFFLVIRKEGMNCVFPLDEESKPVTERADEIRTYLIKVIGLRKEQTESIIKIFMEQGLVQTTHFY